MEVTGDFGEESYFLYHVFKFHIGLIFSVTSRRKLSLLGPWASWSPLGLFQVVVKLSLKKKRRFWLLFWSLSPDIQLFPESLGDVIFRMNMLVNKVTSMKEMMFVNLHGAQMYRKKHLKII